MYRKLNQILINDSHALQVLALLAALKKPFTAFKTGLEGGIRLHVIEVHKLYPNFLSFIFAEHLFIRSHYADCRFCSRFLKQACWAELFVLLEMLRDLQTCTHRYNKANTAGDRTQSFQTHDSTYRVTV